MLTTIEQQDLERCEAVIERGLQTFYEVGMALLEIRERRLYKQDYTSFEVYCRERWNFSGGHAYSLMDSATVITNLSSIDETFDLPANREQLRPLAKLKDPEEQAEAWQRAVDTAPNGKVTGFHVQGVVNEILGKEPPKPRFPWQGRDEEATTKDDLTVQEERTIRESQMVAGDTEDEPAGYSQAWSPEPEAPPGGNGLKPRLQPLMTSDTPEWYTPVEIIERTLALFGGTIDLDPCSNAATADNPNVPAERHFTEADDGLSRTWEGSVYMNPPYGNVIKEWVYKLADEFDAGNVTEAVALVPARTDTKWMRRLAEYPRCYIWGRLSFSEHENSAPFPSVVIYLGNNLQEFADLFGDMGDVYVKYRG